MVRKIVFLLVLSISPLVAKRDTFSGHSQVQDHTFDELAISGSGQLNNITARILDTSGSLHFKTVTVTEFFEGSGRVQGAGLDAAVCDFSGHKTITDARIKKLNASGRSVLESVKIATDCCLSGSSECDKLMVSQRLIASGALVVRNSSLHEVECSSGARLYDTTVSGTVTVNDSSSTRTGWEITIPFLKWLFGLFTSSKEPQQPSLFLYGATKIEGDIVFIGRTDGLVYVDPTVKIVGTVRGGTIVKN